MTEYCVYNYKSLNQSIFNVPKHLKKEWEIALNMELNYSSKICAVHFHPNDITTT